MKVCHDNGTQQETNEMSLAELSRDLSRLSRRRRLESTETK
jgi:hypothetical protein